MRYHVRCSKEACKLRAVFAKHPDDYKVPRKCPGCGGGVKYRVIKDRVADRGATNCQCGHMLPIGKKPPGAEYPHRLGTPGCAYNNDGTLRYPGDDTDYDRIPLEGDYARWVLWCPTMQAFAGTLAEGWRGFTAAIMAQDVDSPTDISDTSLGGL